MSKDLNKISPTAIMCAQFRKDYTNLPYAKEISEELDKLYAKGEVNYEKNFTGMLNIAIKTLSKIYPEILIMPVIFEGRYYSTNEALKILKKKKFRKIITL